MIPRLAIVILGWSALAGIGEAWSGEPKNQTPTATDGETVDLPRIEVVESKPLPPPETWRYARIQGFEVLSNASDRATARLLTDFQRFHQALEIAWPAAQTPNTLPAALILCGRGGKFEVFKPAKDTGVDSGLITVSYRDDESAAIVVDLETTTLNLLTPEAMDQALAAAEASFTASADDPPTGRAPSDFIVDHYKQLYREYIHFVLSRAQPRAAAWLEEGLAQIFMRMEYSSKWIIVGRVEDPNRKSAIDGAIEDRDFNVMLQRRALIPLAEMFAVAHDSPIAQHPVGSVWAKQCYAFVHFCLYGNKGRLQKQFFTFITRAGSEPITEAMFKECFGESMSSVLTELRGYIEYTTYKSTEFHAKKGVEIPEPPKVEFRDATQAEIGRIKGEALRLAGKKDAARDALVAPYVRGERDPQLLAALGIFEQSQGDEGRARKFLEAAAAAKVYRPRAYLSLAQLRYTDALAADGGQEGKLTADQVMQILRPLFTARSQPPPLPEVYGLIADVWAHSAVIPKHENLEVVLEGARLFFRRPEFLYHVASLMNQYGYKNDVRVLANVGLQVTTDATLRDRFAALKIAAGPAPEPAVPAPAPVPK